jgi:pyruvate/2-oxoacid:ferredoxin oxidoreductase alpha subunit/pyruvate/2-oxoacid:ferredoxin oxidoreductase beta subunit
MVRKAMTGNKAFAHGVRLSKVKVIASYPITPQTTLVEYLADFVNDGYLEAEYIRSEGEHGMMAQAIGAAQTGVRTFTSTCSAGFAYAFQGIVSAPGLRLGNLMLANINRPMGVPGGLQADHSDGLTARDWGWVYLFGEHHQEILDTVIQAYRIGEDRRVLLPTMVGGEGYYISYTTDLVDLPDQGLVDGFLPDYKPIGAIDADNPMSPSIFGTPEMMMGMKYSVHDAQLRAKKVIQEVNKEFEEAFGRSYGNGLIEEYKMEDAEVALVTMGSFTGNARKAVDDMRKDGKKAGLVKIRSFRPFPTEDFQRIAEKVQAFVAVSRHDSAGGAGAPVGYDIKSALYNMDERPIVQDVVSGITGVEINSDDFVYLAEQGFKALKDGRFERDMVWYPKINITERYEVPPMPELLKKSFVMPGTGACQGCGMTLVWKTVMEAAGRDTVYVSTSGCGGWSGPHTMAIGTGGAAGNLPAGAATTTGIKRGLVAQGKTSTNVILGSGDGSFGDMGFMSASGAAERNEDILMFVYDNQAYMNTGMQRSGATPYLAWTTTTPVGSEVQGKQANAKPLANIMIAHGIPYVATASASHMPDLKRKIKKALSIKGCKYLHIYSPCPTGHRYPPEKAIEVSRLAVESGMWPLYEVDNGVYNITVKPREFKPVKEYLTVQGRFRHVKEPDFEILQEITDKEYKYLEMLEKITKNEAH